MAPTPTTPHEPAAQRLRTAMVDGITADGLAQAPGVEEALREVPRHVFVPEADLEQAYAMRTSIDIKVDTDGTSLSCASQPSVVAALLDQLEARPGERILELGAGSGYNAALLAHLVGPEGHVTTIDIDADLVEGARARLAEAGVDNVDVVLGDGADGYAAHAPYDRIIATVGAHGLPAAWQQQLATGGRLVVPQRLVGTVARSIAWEQHGHHYWVSRSSRMNTFMPLRRGIADDPRTVIPLSRRSTVRLQAPASAGIDPAPLDGVLEQPHAQEWTGMRVQAMESPEWMEMWVGAAFREFGGLIRMLFPAEAKGDVLVDDPYPSSSAVVDKASLAYLARRRLTETTPEGAALWEFGAIAHGPDAHGLAGRLAEAVRTWDRNIRNNAEPAFELHDRAAVPAPRPGRFVLDTGINFVQVDFS